MNYMDMIQSIYSSVGVVVPTIIQLLVQSVIVSIFLRNNISTKEFETIKAGQLNEALTQLLNSGKMTYTELYKANNFLSIAKIADEKYCKKKEYNSNTVYDFDWFINYYENVGNVSDEIMQDIWARILAQEVDEPNSISIKTLNILKSIGKKEALLFQKLSDFALKYNDAYFIPNIQEYLDKNNIEYSDILLLDEYGLINNNPLIGLNFIVDKEYVLITNSDNMGIVVRSEEDNERKMTFNCYTYTSSGNAINKALGIKVDNEKLFQFANIIKNNWKNIIVEVKKYKIINGKKEFGDNVIF